MKYQFTRITYFMVVVGLLLISNGFAATFTVDIAADDSDAHDINPGNGVCEDSFGFCTLRAAIEEANATAAPDVILFANGFIDAHLVLAASEGPLPAIVNQVFILGSSIDAYNSSATLLRDAPPQFTIDGSQLSSSGYDGLFFYGAGASDSVVSALSIINFPGNGVYAGNGVERLSIERMYIGVHPDRSAGGNGLNGINLSSVDYATIGKNLNNGNFEGLGNVISNNGYSGIRLFNSFAARIVGNLIGISPSGTGDRGNGYYGINISGDTNYVGEASGQVSVGNFVAGNNLGGILISGNNNRVFSNSLGKGETGGFISSEGDGVAAIGSGNIIGGFDGRANKVNAHSGTAIKVGSASSSPANNNSVIANEIGSSGQLFSILRSGNGQGINIENANSNSITSNRVINSAGIGIRIRGDSNNLSGNYVGYVDAIHGTQGPEPNKTGLDIEGDLNAIGSNSSGVGNYISGNLENGVHISGDNEFENNLVGVTAAFSPMGNGGCGIRSYLSTTSFRHNIVGANDSCGIWLFSSQDLEVSGNYIGVDPDGKNIGNGEDGIVLSGSLASFTYQVDITNNVIAFNNGNGIRTTFFYVTRAKWVSNVMYGNIQGGVDIGSNGHTINDPDDEDEDSNRTQNYPDIMDVIFTEAGVNSSVSITYKMDTATTNADYPLEVDFYWNNQDEAAQGKYYIGTAPHYSPDSSVTFIANLGQAAEYGWITGVGRDASGNSSEFSPTVMFGERNDILFSDSFEDD